MLIYLLSCMKFSTFIDGSKFTYSYSLTFVYLLYTCVFVCQYQRQAKFNLGIEYHTILYVTFSSSRITPLVECSYQLLPLLGLKAKWIVTKHINDFEQQQLLFQVQIDKHQIAQLSLNQVIYFRSSLIRMKQHTFCIFFLVQFLCMKYEGTCRINLEIMGLVDC